MANNVSKYIQLNDFILLEYEFCKDETNTKKLQDLNPFVIQLRNKDLQYIENSVKSNNTLGQISIPLDNENTKWKLVSNYSDMLPYILDDKQPINESYNFDRVRLHIVTGYFFQDCDGFLLKIKANNIDGNNVYISNYTHTKNNLEYGKNIFFNNNPITISNKIYDKYIELDIPSIYDLGVDINKNKKDFLSNILNIAKLSDILIEFGTIPYGSLSENNDEYVLNGNIKTNLPVVSIADNFNCFIKESQSGDYIEYYATWKDSIIGRYINDIESGIIPLYTSNNPNDNYEEFDELWGDNRKWIVIHEIEIIEHIGLSQSLITQKIAFTQDSNFDTPNLYRPIIINSDISNAVTISYKCKLLNRMDGSQLVRQSSFNINDPKKYGKNLNRLNANNIYNFNVRNVIDRNEITQETINKSVTKFVKVYYDTTKIVMDEDNNILENGDGVLYIKNGNSNIKLLFSRLNKDNIKQNVDLSGLFSYEMRIPLRDGSVIISKMTNSINMNMVLGQLEFHLTEIDAQKIINQGSGIFTIEIVNSDKSRYTFYQGKISSYKDK